MIDLSLQIDLLMTNNETFDKKALVGVLYKYSLKIITLRLRVIYLIVISLQVTSQTEGVHLRIQIPRDIGTVVLII